MAAWVAPAIGAGISLADKIFSGGSSGDGYKVEKKTAQKLGKLETVKGEYAVKLMEYEAEKKLDYQNLQTKLAKTQGLTTMRSPNVSIVQQSRPQPPIALLVLLGVIIKWGTS